MTQEIEAQLRQEVVRLQEQQRILELKKRLKQEGEYRYLMILLGQEANQSREKIATQLNSISQQLYDLNKVLARNKGIEIEGEEVPDIEPKETKEEVEEPIEETPEIVEEEVEPKEEVEEPKEPKKETKEQKKVRKEIEKLQKKIDKLNQ